MNAKEMAAEIKRVGLLRAGNLQDELNALAIRLEDEVTDLRTKNSALQLSQDNIINALGITGDGPVSKSVIEYVMGLVAENVALKAAGKDLLSGWHYIRHSGWEEKIYGVGWDRADTAMTSALETPNTDAAIAEIKAQGVDDFASFILRDACGDRESERDVGEVIESAEEFAANLRAGRNG
ncbi:hypothetical protein [Ewingella americana]